MEKKERKKHEEELKENKGEEQKQHFLDNRSIVFPT
jgi:hypothetical protein